MEWFDILLEYLPSIVNGLITLVLVFVAKKTGNHKAENALVDKLNELVNEMKKLK